MPDQSCKASVPPPGKTKSLRSPFFGTIACLVSIRGSSPIECLMSFLSPVFWNQNLCVVTAHLAKFAERMQSCALIPIAFSKYSVIMSPSLLCGPSWKESYVASKKIFCHVSPSISFLTCISRFHAAASFCCSILFPDFGVF